MKKMIAALLVVLCLAGCSAKEEQPATQQIDTDIPVQTQTEEKPTDTVEIPVDIVDKNASEPETVAPAEALEHTSEHLEGLVGDAIGYSLEYPVFADFAAAETVNNFYVDLVTKLESYTQQTVNQQCLERNCVADVYGEVTSARMENGELAVDYEYRVEYSDTEEPVINERTDIWNVQTGEVTSEVG